MKAWMRELEVILTSTTCKKQYVFGRNWKEGKDDIAIDIVGYKYLSALKDNFVVRLNNLTYGEVVKLIKGKFYDIEIRAGYHSTGAKTIFKGSVIYMSKELGDRLTSTLIILAGSKLVAAYGQSRMNLTLNSGINMYSAIEFICRRAGVRNANIDEDLKNQVIREASSVQNTIGDWLELFTSANNLIIQTDSTYSNDITLISPYRKNNRVIKLNKDNIILTGGYPTVNSDGLSFSTLPTFNFMPMDVIILDNSVIDISVSNLDQSQFNNSMFLDKDSKYLITQIEYRLQNRGQSFMLSIKGKARSLFSLIGGSNG